MLGSNELNLMTEQKASSAMSRNLVSKSLQLHMHSNCQFPYCCVLGVYIYIYKYISNLSFHTRLGLFLPLISLIFLFAPSKHQILIVNNSRLCLRCWRHLSLYGNLPAFAPKISHGFMAWPSQFNQLSTSLCNAPSRV